MELRAQWAQSRVITDRTNNLPMPLRIALYEKMCAEQETYRAWLLSQPPEEILNHACYVYFKPSRRRPCLLFPLSGKYGKQRASKVFKASNFVDALKRY